MISLNSEFENCYYDVVNVLPTVCRSVSDVNGRIITSDETSAHRLLGENAFCKYWQCGLK